MNSKLFILLTLTHYVVSFNLNPFHLAKNYPHWKLTQRTYDTRPVKLAESDNVGEPLLLTPFIENGQILEARAAARVNDTHLLPGTESYAGYLTVNKRYHGNLWFWYFPNTKTVVGETPLILWLQGGPGASSLYGLFTEIGPFIVLDNGTLTENEYSWGKYYSLLFIDNPVGTGFSFVDRGGYATNQTTIAKNLYTGLQQFFTLFPELRSAPLFIAGESYAGKHIPSVAIQIHWRKSQDAPINLKGLAIGNGFIDPVTIMRLSYFGREVGLVDDKTADSMKFLETKIEKFISENDTKAAFKLFNQILAKFLGAANLSNNYNYLSDDTKLHGTYTDFVQRPELRRALHVGSTQFSPTNIIVYVKLIPDFMNSAKPWLEELLDNYPVLVYSGHLDCMVPYHGSVYTYKTLNYSGAQEYKEAKRFPWRHNGTLAGYVKKGGNLSEVMVRGAGHMVPADRPAQARALVTAFIGGVPLTEDTGHLDLLDN